MWSIENKKNPLNFFFSNILRKNDLLKEKEFFIKNNFFSFVFMKGKFVILYEILSIFYQVHRNIIYLEKLKI